MAARGFLDAFWSESFWFPANRSYGWKDLENKPGASVYYPDIKHLHWAFLLGVVLIGVRSVMERIVVAPIAQWVGVPTKKRRPVTPNSTLEAAYITKHHLTKDTVKVLSKQTDLSERQIERWFRKRKKMDTPTPLQKFGECSWHLVFYTAFFVYGIVYLWQKPYFWKTIECWRDWPKQDVADDIYWHYLLELAFYWSLVFTLFSDAKRKDFTQMIVHHIATMVLMYFSWVLNFVRIGTLVLVVHDAADTWLALAKMSIYAGSPTATDIFFGVFLLVWIVSRLIVYPFVVLYCTTVEPYTIKLIDTTFGAHGFFNFFLYILLILHFIWTYMIFRIVYRKMVKGNVEDVRSDSEESGAESDTEDEESEENNDGKMNKIQENGGGDKTHKNGIKENGSLPNGFVKTVNGRNGHVTGDGK